MQLPSLCYQARGAVRRKVGMAHARHRELRASRRPRDARGGARARARARARGDAAHGHLPQSAAKSYAFFATAAALALPIIAGGSLLGCCVAAISPLSRFLESAPS